MSTVNKIDFKKTSLAVASLYAVCIAVLMAIHVKPFYANASLIRLIAVWFWIVTPQFVLSLYVSKFTTRWIQLISLLLQVAIVFSLYHYWAAVFIESDDIEHEMVFFNLPIWHYVIVATAGLIMKIIQSY